MIILFFEKKNNIIQLVLIDFFIVYFSNNIRVIRVNNVCVLHWKQFVSVLLIP